MNSQNPDDVDDAIRILETKFTEDEVNQFTGALKFVNETNGSKFELFYARKLDANVPAQTETAIRMGVPHSNLVINESIFEIMETNQAAAGLGNWLVPQNAKEVVLHEAGHLLHHATADPVLMRGAYEFYLYDLFKISRYAVTNPAEMYAESYVVASNIAGKYPKDVVGMAKDIIEMSTKK